MENNNEKLPIKKEIPVKEMPVKEEITEEKPDEPFIDRERKEQLSVKQLWVGEIKDIVTKAVYALLTETQKDDLTDGGATTLHKHDHGGLDGLNDNDHGAIYYTETEIDALVAARLANVVEDTSPQLGGDLDMNSKKIDFASVANVSDCKDEDDMATDSATMLATQQSIKKYVDDNAGLISNAIVADFQANAATGFGATDPERINDDNEGNYGYVETVGHYFIVDYGKIVQITKFRHKGLSIGQTGGKWKVQVRNLFDGTFHDWITDVDIEQAGSWTSFTTANQVITDEIRIVCTTLPSGSSAYIAEAEVIGD